MSEATKVPSAVETDEERARRLEAYVVRARELSQEFSRDVKGLTDERGEALPKHQDTYDGILSNYEADAWELVTSLARLAKGDA
jgi:hypothetical protein